MTSPPDTWLDSPEKQAFDDTFCGHAREVLDTLLRSGPGGREAALNALLKYAERYAGELSELKRRHTRARR